MLSLRRWVAFILMVAPGMAPAQEEPVAERRLRVLAVGDVPPFRQEIRNGVRYELEAPAGSVPPREVEVFAEGAGKGILDLKLKQVSGEVVIPGSGLEVSLRDGDKPWHSVKVPEGGDALAVMWRDFKGGTWDRARSVALRDGPGFAGGEVRFVNICPVAVGVILGKERFVVEKGAVVKRKVGVVDGIPIYISYSKPRGGSERVYSSAFVQNRGERTTVVIYRADGKEPRKPVKSIILRETIPPPLKPKQERAGG